MLLCLEVHSTFSISHLASLLRGEGGRGRGSEGEGKGRKEDGELNGGSQWPQAGRSLGKKTEKEGLQNL